MKLAIPKPFWTAISTLSSTNTSWRKLLERSSRRCVTLPYPLAPATPLERRCENYDRAGDRLQPTDVDGPRGAAPDYTGAHGHERRVDDRLRIGDEGVRAGRCRAE